MDMLANCVRRFLNEECAVSTVEYAVMLALIVLVSIVAIVSIGTKVDATYNTLSTNLPSGQ